MSAHEDRIRDVRFAIVAIDNAITSASETERLTKEAYVTVRHIAGSGENSPLSRARNTADTAGEASRDVVLALSAVQDNIIGYLGRIL